MKDGRKEEWKESIKVGRVETERAAGLWEETKKDMKKENKERKKERKKEENLKEEQEQETTGIEIKRRIR
mgnify:CR=1 FL=1